MQDGQLLTTAMMSFLAGGQSLEHAITPPDLPDPLSVPPVDDLLQGYEDVVPHFVNALRPIDWRYTNDPTWVMRSKGEKLAYNRVWMKTVAAMPADPVLHTAALVYSSDTTVLDSIISTHGLSWGFDRIFAVTANHTVWFHRPVRFDDWVLYSTESPVAADSRALGTGHFFDQSGALLATVVQEGIVKYFPGSTR
jgi:acyl-CoA thioesterase-2